MVGAADDRRGARQGRCRDGRRGVQGARGPVRTAPSAPKARRDHETRSKRLDRRERTETLDLGLALVGLWYRDAAAIAWGAEDLVCHADRLAELHADAQGADATRLRDAVELVEDARRRLVLNVGEELTCEALGYRLEALLMR